MVALLARLALWPRRDHAREELAELLWPNVDVGTGRRRLRQALSMLRVILEPPGKDPWPVVQADRLCVRLIPGAVACDVHHFETHARAGRREAALATYRGELMPGFFDEWIHDERMRLAALHDRLVGTADIPIGTVPSAAPTGPPAQSVPPPGAAVSAHWPPLAAPAYATSYFPERAQVERLRRAVLSHRLVTLLGPGGSGKTRLAVHLAHQLQASTATHPFATATASPAGWQGPVVFVPLAGAQSEEQFLAAVQAALHIQATPASMENLLTRLEGQRALLVLDNVEQLCGGAASLVDTLATRLPLLHLVSTSRLRLGLDGEREFLIQPLPVPPARGALKDAADSPAVALFVDRACAVRGDFHLSERNHQAVIELVRELEGMPLAIELAASRIRAFSLAHMLNTLRSGASAPGRTPGLDLLSRPQQRPALQSRHASMQRTIAWSWQQLTAQQQQLVGAMTAFPGGCDASMLGAVRGADDVGAGLEQLHAHSLIREQATEAAASTLDEAAGAEEPLRFQLYVPIREFAAAQFDPQSHARWRRRQREWAIGWLSAMPATPPLAWVRSELTNLGAAFASAADDGAGDDAARLVWRLQALHEGVTLPASTLAHASAALHHCADPSLRSRGCSALSPWLLTAGDTPHARRLAEAAIDCAPPDGAVRAWALCALAHVHWRGALSAASAVQPWTQEALRIAEAEDDPDLLGSVLTIVSLVRWGLDGDAEAARASSARARAVWEASGNRLGVNLARHNVAVFDFRSGRRTQALDSWDEIAAEAEVLQDTRRLAITNSARATALSEMRRWPEARQALRSSLRQSWQAMRLYDVAYDLWNLPRVLAHLREPEDAQCLMTFAAQLWQQRFGTLDRGDWRHVAKVERMAALHADKRTLAAAAARGRQMPLAEAVALALRE
ncbi:AAA family ATPase [Piscinibacter sakaiensis]|uniref:ORC1/DEAH AAA+ ATPase domain-containing protein n=2 Tax=Piscinibacter sakaiensis TaxID=1547922 RepID=A0A0K8P118_PISS1|nr:AAA family ATPase [Piscinibacter sakaiensis]GAP36229.1 hypothetical protein ISF6_2069 [Piscinibacter sakaiensis]